MSMVNSARAHEQCSSISMASRRAAHRPARAPGIGHESNTRAMGASERRGRADWARGWRARRGAARAERRGVRLPAPRRASGACKCKCNGGVEQMLEVEVERTPGARRSRSRALLDSCSSSACRALAGCVDLAGNCDID